MQLQGLQNVQLTADRSQREHLGATSATLHQHALSLCAAYFCRDKITIVVTTLPNMGQVS